MFDPIAFLQLLVEGFVGAYFEAKADLPAQRGILGCAIIFFGLFALIVVWLVCH